MKVEYGIMSNKWEIEAPSKLTAYAAILISLPTVTNMIVLYTEDCKNDQWAFSQSVSERIGEIFGGDINDFYMYVDTHEDEIHKVIDSIKKLI